MRAVELKGKNIVIWGTGREGKAVAQFIRRFVPGQSFVFIDEAKGNDRIEGLDGDYQVIREPAAITETLAKAEVLVKSPGVSLYHPQIEALRQRSVPVTSLLNLWFAEPRRSKTICVTGTKGKSTTSALLAHTLNKLGRKTALAGNIGIPISEASGQDEFTVVELSSFQTTNFDGHCDIAVLTALSPEHLDWHGTLERYYGDKLNLLGHADTKIIGRQAQEAAQRTGLKLPEATVANIPDGIHTDNGHIYMQKADLGGIKNPHLARAHNLANICIVLTVIQALGLDVKQALAAMEDFQGLPHRQHELGEKDGILYVDDSISTTPLSAIAAIEVYRNRPITLIAGGFDRGIDYTPLADHVIAAKLNTVICLGPSGNRIMRLLREKGQRGNVFIAVSMQEALEIARKNTPKGGTVLLSPGAPSFGMFRDYEERGQAFAKEAGF